MNPAWCYFCGKQRFKSEENALRKIRRRGQQCGLSLRAYECVAGNGWHITKAPKKTIYQSG